MDKIDTEMTRRRRFKENRYRHTHNILAENRFSRDIGSKKE